MKLINESEPMILNLAPREIQLVACGVEDEDIPYIIGGAFLIAARIIVDIVGIAVIAGGIACCIKPCKTSMHAPLTTRMHGYEIIHGFQQTRTGYACRLLASLPIMLGMSTFVIGTYMIITGGWFSFLLSLHKQETARF